MSTLRFSSLLILLLQLPSTARAEDGVAENHLVEAAFAYRDKDWNTAFAELQRARSAAVSPLLRARIERQAGLLYVATERPAEAFAAFRQAFQLDPELTLDLSSFGPKVRSLFDCAKTWKASEPEPRTFDVQASGGYRCPSAEPPPAPPPPAEVSALPAPEPSPPERPTLGPLGGVGIGLMAAGLVGGGSLAGWQLSESGSAGSDIERLDARVDAGQGGPLVTRALNEANQRQADADRNAAIAAGVGGAVAVTGIVLLVLDLTDTPLVAERTGWVFSPGPASAALTVPF